MLSFCLLQNRVSFGKELIHVMGWTVTVKNTQY